VLTLESLCIGAFVVVASEAALMVVLALMAGRPLRKAWITRGRSLIMSTPLASVTGAQLPPDDRAVAPLLDLGMSACYATAGGAGILATIIPAASEYPAALFVLTLGAIVLLLPPMLYHALALLVACIVTGAARGYRLAMAAALGVAHLALCILALVAVQQWAFGAFLVLTNGAYPAQLMYDLALMVESFVLLVTAFFVLWELFGVADSIRARPRKKK
jgi:hypothetical protein